MPFIPPVSIARSVSGLTGKESNSSASTANKVCKEGSSVKERITLNLKQLGKKSHVPTEAKRRDKLVTPKQSERTTTAGSAVQPSPSQGAVKTGSEIKSRVRGQEEAHFTLTLTPEAVLLLQRRSSERHQRANKSSAANGGGATDSKHNGRRRETPSKRQQSSQRRSASGLRVNPKTTGDNDMDLSSILQISLLNEQHRYDDVDYEEEEACVDQRVVLKCTEWLRGLESPLTTAGVRKSIGKSC